MKTILYIEDEPEQVELIRARLEANGYRLIAASDGEEGAAMARKEKPDLVIIDHFLPKIKGLDLCRMLKEGPDTKDIPIIFLTASGVKYIAEQSRTAGANACIKKPYEAQELIDTIKSLLKE